MGRRYSLFIIFLLAPIWLTVDSADAIPAFARKYGTSCTTCHTAFPKLNNFGEAFRLNGYVIPEGEEDMLKEEPAELGSEAYKRVWPDAVWPGTMPAHSPIGVLISNGFSYQKHEEVKTNFLAPTVDLLVGGNFGESIGFYSDLHLFENGELGSLGRAFVQFNNLFYEHLPETRLYLRLGQFFPNAIPFANHRNLTLNSFALNTYYPALGNAFAGGHAHGDESGFNLENLQLGAELSGIIQRRFRFGVGLVNGNGPEGDNNNAKDGYFRAAVKFGGMAFDGSTPGGSDEQATQIDNAREYSVRLGVFGYKGGADNVADTGPKDLKFHRIGGDISLNLSSLNLFGGYVQGRDRLVTGNGVEPIDYNLWFTQADLMIYPWLIGALRYETAKPEDLDRVSRIVPHVTVLARANVKLVLETALDTDNPEIEDFQTIVQFAF